MELSQFCRSENTAEGVFTTQCIEHLFTTTKKFYRNEQGENTATHLGFL